MKSKFESALIRFYCNERIDPLYFVSVVCKPLTKVEFIVENVIDDCFFYRVDILKDSKKPSIVSMVKEVVALKERIEYVVKNARINDLEIHGL